MAKTTLIGRVGRGLVAGVIGTASMTAWQELSAKLQNSQGQGEESQDSVGSLGRSFRAGQGRAPAPEGARL